jgi:hypothetical protein
MHFKLIKTAVGGLSLLIATVGYAAPQDLPVKFVSVPSYSIITDTLFNLTPLVAGKRNTFLMQQICDLARGDATQQDVNQRLIQNNIDPMQLAKAGAAGMLVLKSEITDRQLACAAYLATSLFQPVDMTSYYPQGQKAPEKEESSWLPWRSAKEEKAENRRFQSDRFIHDSKVQLAVARATAQLYAVIAQNVPQQPISDWKTRQQQIAEVLKNYAAEYLKSIDSFYKAEAGAALSLDYLTASSYSVHNANGNRLVKKGEDMELFSRGVTWLGNGMIIGKNYFVDITILAAPAKVAERKETEQKKK